MQHIGTVSRPRLILAAALTAPLAVGGLLPWRVVAQSGTAASVSPTAPQTEDAMMEKNRVEIASRSAKLDSEFADFLKHMYPAQQKKAEAAIAFLTADASHDQKHIQMLEQHRAAYVAAHPNRLTDAQIAEVQRINWQIREPDRISEGIRWEQIIKGKLQAHLAASRDARSKTGWQRQIAAIDQRRREAERRIRELEPRIAHQKAELETIPADQRARVARVRSYDSEISAYRNIAVMGKEVELSLLRQRITGKFPAKRQNGGATTQTSSAPPKAKTAFFDAVVIGGPTPLRLAQSVVAPPVPPGVAHTEAKWEELERKQHADIDSRNAQADAQLADIQKHLLPAQLKAVQSQIAFANAEYAKEQKRVQISEQSRAAYIASHPNRLSDSQIAFIQKVNWAQMHHSYISRGVRAELRAIPKDQRDRVAILRSYDGEISGGRMMALIEKQAWVEVLRQKIAGKGNWPVQPHHAATEMQRPRTFQIAFRVPHQGTHRVRILARDATGRHLLLDKVCRAGESVNIPATAHGNKVGFLIYEDGKLVKNQSL